MNFLKQNLVKLTMGTLVIMAFVLLMTGEDKSSDPASISIPVVELSKEAQAIVNKENPTFNEIVFVICNNGNEETLRGRQVTWRAKVSGHAHTGGIRFLVIDEDHPEGLHDKHGHFWGTFLVSADDPRVKEDGYIEWAERWHSSWVRYILDNFGNIKYEDWDENTIFEVIATIDRASCEEVDGDFVANEGGYIETSAVKIRKIR